MTTTPLVNQHWQNFSGEPITGRIPTKTRMMNNVPMNQLQAAGVAHAYKLFTDAVHVTPAKFLIQERILLDGTRVRMVSNQGDDTVMVWPVGIEPFTKNSFVAYPVYYDLSFCPVYTRETFDSPGQVPPGPAPEYVPYPAFVPLPIPAGTSYGVQLLYAPHPTFTLEKYVKEAVFVTVLLGAASKSTIRTFEPFTSLFSGSYPSSGVEIDTPNLRFHITPGNIGDPGYDVDSNVYYRGSPYTYTRAESNQPIVRDYAINVQYLSLVDGVLAQDAVTMANYIAAEALAEAAYIKARNVYNAAYAASLAEWKAKQAGSAGPAPLSGIRAAGREVQITMLKTFLDTGIRPPHLMARNLALPFNIGTKPAPPKMGTSPVLTLTATGILETSKDPVYDAEGQYVTVTATDAMYLTIKPATEVYGQAVVASSGKFGKDVAANSGLFSWKATGDYQLYQKYPFYHGYEKDEVRPPDLSTLTFTERPGYTAFANGGFVADSALDLTINSDAYLPPGTRALIVQYEYEAYDSYSGAWVWTPCLELFDMDSIWIKSLGFFSMPQLTIADEMTPRALRARAVTKQIRKKDWSWTAAVAMPHNALPKNWNKQQTITSTWKRDFYPSAVAVIMGMSNAAKPIANGTTVFPFNAKHLWSGKPAAIKEALKQPWITAIKIEQIIAHALNIVKKEI